MNIYSYVSVYTYTDWHADASTHTYIHTYMNGNTEELMDAHAANAIRRYIRTSTQTCAQQYEHSHILQRTYPHPHTHIYPNTHTHTHTSTHTHPHTGAHTRRTSD
eukprot:GHVU01055935.1.p2 GENE.GHVU01055935.1~~GHVU01055935.1.p2  ORF type:complete len:105 (+),score=5.62 GHVU01055935.1:431-745(+)